MRPPTLDPRTETPRDPRAALLAHVRTALNGPLSALRVVLEGERGQRPGADRALDELLRIERAVRDLVAWSAPAPVRAVPCTLEEVANALRQRLAADECSRLWISVEEPRARVVIDGARVVDVLERLARASLARRDAEALLHVHADEDTASFSIVDDPGEAAGAAVEVPPDLALLLAEREAERLGGTCRVHATSPEHRCVVLRVPREGATR